MSSKSKTVQDKASYNGRPIESHVWSSERHHFQWPWWCQGQAIPWCWISPNG